MASRAPRWFSLSARWERSEWGPDGRGACILALVLASQLLCDLGPVAKSDSTLQSQGVIAASVDVPELALQSSLEYRSSEAVAAKSNPRSNCLFRDGLSSPRSCCFTAPVPKLARSKLTQVCLPPGIAMEPSPKAGGVLTLLGAGHPYTHCLPRFFCWLRWIRALYAPCAGSAHCLGMRLSSHFSLGLLINMDGACC